CRAHRRAGAEERAAAPPAAPLQRGVAAGPAGLQPERRPAPRTARRATRTGRSAGRLPLPSALPAGRRGLPLRRQPAGRDLLLGDRLPALGPHPAMTALLELSDLNVTLSSAGRPAKRGRSLIRAVSGVSFDLARGETLGLLGETGAGKTTLARAIVSHLESAAGAIHFHDKPLRTLRGKAFAEYRRKAQLIPADAVGSLNPLLTVEETLAEPLAAHQLCPRAEIKARVAQLMVMVGLPPERRRFR